ncbi:MAG TPA: RelA/SpoT domain-containing protein [Rhodocyclaceae bacterium]
MQHATPQNSRALVDRAGRVLAAEESTADAIERAWEVLANWRSSHAFPLNTITMNLRQKVNRLHQAGLVVQRLKRTRSILAKLVREPSMRLTQMQDIGGCRAVVESIDDVYALHEKYKQSRSIHEFVAEYDYIASPKPSGYRSLHLVYRFRSNSRPEYNKLLFEIQLRTVTQHAWATAVETVGAVIGQALKSSEGEQVWLSYFQLASRALEHLEQPSMPVCGAYTKGMIARSLGELSNRLDVRRKLTAYRTALKETEKLHAKGARYFLLVLLPEQPGLQVFAFDKRHAEEAHQAYQRFERQMPLRTRQLPLFPELADYSGAQVVLVGAESLRSIREAFPNYYLDTAVYLEKISEFMRRYRRST